MECFHWSKSREVGKEQRKDRRIEKGDEPCRLRETRKQRRAGTTIIRRNGRRARKGRAGRQGRAGAGYVNPRKA